MATRNRFLLIIISCLGSLMSCNNSENNNDGSTSQQTAKKRVEIQITDIRSSGEDSIELKIISDTITGEEYFYEISGDTVKKYNGNGDYVTSVVSTGNVNDDFLKAQIQKDLSDTQVVYLRPRPMGGSDGCLSWIKRIPSLRILSVTPGCRAALCKYYACKKEGECGGETETSTRNYACAACYATVECSEDDLPTPRKGKRFSFEVDKAASVQTEAK